MEKVYFRTVLWREDVRRGASVRSRREQKPSAHIPFGDTTAIAGDETAIAGDKISVAGDETAAAGNKASVAGGTLYGDTNNIHTPGANENTALIGDANTLFGHAAYCYRNPITAAGPAVPLDSTSDDNWE